MWSINGTQRTEPLTDIDLPERSLNKLILLISITREQFEGDDWRVSEALESVEEHVGVSGARMVGDSIYEWVEVNVTSDAQRKSLLRLCNDLKVIGASIDFYCYHGSTPPSEALEQSHPGLLS
jgi:hypothetical protein